ncbi:MAG: serine protease [Planctomycetes bacterium]|nr:serine protease [Planctomycetota bacterium]
MRFSNVLHAAALVALAALSAQAQTQAERSAGPSDSSLGLVRVEADVALGCSPWRNPLDRWPTLRRLQLDWILGTSPDLRTRAGLGVVASHDGFVVTAPGLVQGAEHVRVALPDGRRVSASVAAVDTAAEVAVLRVDPGTRLPGSASEVSAEAGQTLHVGRLDAAPAPRGWSVGSCDDALTAVFPGRLSAPPGAPLVGEGGAVAGYNARALELPLLAGSSLTWVWATPPARVRALLAECGCATDCDANAWRRWLWGLPFEPQAHD